MKEIFDTIYLFIRAVWRRRWQALVVASLLCIVAWPMIFMMPDQFTATARVYIDADSFLRRILKDQTVQTDVNQKVTRVTREILSRPNLEKVAVETDLHLRAEGELQFEGLINMLEEKISITRKKGKQEYVISFDDSDPQMAKRVVQSLLTQLVESSLNAKRTDTDVAQKFLDQQIDDHEQRLREAEQRVEQFKRDNVGLLPGEGRGYYANLQEAQANLRSAELEVRQLEQRKAELQRHIEGEEPTFGLGNITNTGAPVQVSSSFDSRIENLEEKLDELMLIYTESHPDVISVKSTIAELKRQREQEIANRPQAVRPGSSGSSVETNPVYQQMRIELSRVEVNIASSRVQLQEFRKQRDELVSKVDAIPRVERELSDLNRDYDTVQSQYQLLLAKKEAALLSEEAEESSNDLKFRILEPAFVPSKPTGPNRSLFYIATMIMGLGMGIGIALLRYLANPTYDTKNQLRDDTGLPVLGTVSLVFTAKEKRAHRSNYFMFAGATACFFGGFVLMFLLERKGVRVEDLAQLLNMN